MYIGNIRGPNKRLVLYGKLAILHGIMVNANDIVNNKNLQNQIIKDKILKILF